MVHYFHKQSERLTCSSFSGDSVEDLDRICRKAKELGIKEIAITDHMDLDVVHLHMNNQWNL